MGDIYTIRDVPRYQENLKLLVLHFELTITSMISCIHTHLDSKFLDIILSLIFYPGMYLALFPFYFYRAWVYCVAAILRPDLTPLDDYGALMGWDAVPSKSSMQKRSTYNVGCALRISGRLDIKRVREIGANKILFRENEFRNRYYPEFFDYVILYGGYCFRKQVKTFNIQEHIYEVKVEDGQSIEKLEGEWVSQPYKPQIPPWAVGIAYLKEVDETILLLKIHHCYGDAYSLLHIFNLLCDNDVPVLPAQPEDPFWEKVMQAIQLPRTFFGFCKGVFRSRNALPFIGNNEGKDWFLSQTTLYFSDMKKIQLKTGAPYIALTLTLFGGVLSRILEAKSKQKGQVSRKTQSTFVQLSLPWPNHPVSKLCNHWTTAGIPVPIGQMKSIDRLTQVEKNYKKIVNSQIDKMIRRFLLAKSSLFPPRLFEKFFELIREKLGLYTVFTSVNAFQTGFYEFDGKPVISVTPIFSFYGKTPVLTGLGFSYNDNYECALIGTSDIADSQEEMDKITKTYFHEELETLQAQLFNEKVV